MCPVSGRFAARQQDEVVSDAPLHHSPLRLPTLFYGILLLPTSPHFSPHHRLLLAVVKRKTHNFSKRVEHRVIWNYEENDRHGLYLPPCNCSTASGALLRSDLSNLVRS